VGGALLPACHILNRIPYKGSDKTPYELWQGRKPSLKYLKVWGCLAIVVVPLNKKRKLGPQSVDCVFLGYAHCSAAYRFLVVRSEVSDITVNSIMESRDATFFEDVFPFCNKPDKSLVNSSDIASSSGSLPLEAESVEPRRSTRPKTGKSFGDDFITYLVEEDPLTFQAAMTSVEAPFWEEAINNEIESIESNNTWVLTDLPPGIKTIGSKWIFRKKLRPDGTIDKFKAHLVAKGYKQREGVDFFDTYSPVARITTNRVLIVMAAIHNLKIHQMDVKTVFLNGDLDEEIYMDQPEGFVILGQERKVC